MCVCVLASLRVRVLFYEYARMRKWMHARIRARKRTHMQRCEHACEVYVHVWARLSPIVRISEYLCLRTSMCMRVFAREHVCACMRVSLCEIVHAWECECVRVGVRVFELKQNQSRSFWVIGKPMQQRKKKFKFKTAQKSRKYTKLLFQFWSNVRNR